MTHAEIRECIDKLIVEKGSKNLSIWTAQFSVKEVLEKANLPNIPNNQRYVIMIFKRWYPECKMLPGQGDNGGFLSIKIRSIR